MTWKNFYNIFNENKEKIIWDENEKEHIISKIDDDKTALFPTEKFIKERVVLFLNMGIGGYGIWDLGNGFESLVDEL